MGLMSPPDDIVRAAVDQARLSPCAKSKRGAVVWIPSSVHGVIASGHNGPPPGVSCDGSAACRLWCRRRCEHAESRALLWVMNWVNAMRRLSLCELVHVKIGADGELVSGGPPSCMPCAVRILDVGLGAVWLYETTPEEWCPHVPMLRTECPMCQGSDCAAYRCPAVGRCEHDVLERHGSLPTVAARWRRYTAVEFHRSTCQHDGVYLGS